MPLSKFRAFGKSRKPCPATKSCRRKEAITQAKRAMRGPIATRRGFETLEWVSGRTCLGLGFACESDRSDAEFKQDDQAMRKGAGGEVFF